MKKVILLLVIFLITYLPLFSQRIIINQNFENTGFNTDSLPPNWVKENVDPEGGPGKQWAVRDSGTNYVGTNVLLVAQAHNSVRALTIPWTAGNPIADDWVFTDTFKVQAGDSLIFWMLIGSPQGFSPYLDTMQVWAMYDQQSVLAIAKLATFKSNDSAGIPLATNVWKQYKLVLSAYAGQTICIGFRYYMNTSVDGFWCNIDDVFIGNRSSIGINPVGSNVPKDFALHQNYPNPFNPTTKIKFDLPRNTDVTLEIYNSLGQVVQTLYKGYASAGYYETEFNADKLPSGAYFCRILTKDFTKVMKMMLIK